jgi:hypothetical protein
MRGYGRERGERAGGRAYGWERFSAARSFQAAWATRMVGADGEIEERREETSVRIVEERRSR